MQWDTVFDADIMMASEADTGKNNLTLRELAFICVIQDDVVLIKIKSCVCKRVNVWIVEMKTGKVCTHKLYNETSATSHRCSAIRSVQYQ